MFSRIARELTPRKDDILKSLEEHMVESFILNVILCVKLFAWLGIVVCCMPGGQMFLLLLLLFLGRSGTIQILRSLTQGLVSAHGIRNQNRKEVGVN